VDPAGQYANLHGVTKVRAVRQGKRSRGSTADGDQLPAIRRSLRPSLFLLPAWIMRDLFGCGTGMAISSIRHIFVYLCV